MYAIRSYYVASQFQNNLYLGLNLNSHFIEYDRTTYLYESNSNAGSLVNEVGFENNLHATGTGRITSYNVCYTKLLRI